MKRDPIGEAMTAVMTLYPRIYFACHTRHVRDPQPSAVGRVVRLRVIHPLEREDLAEVWPLDDRELVDAADVVTARKEAFEHRVTSVRHVEELEAARDRVVRSEAGLNADCGNITPAGRVHDDVLRARARRVPHDS